MPDLLAALLLGAAGIFFLAVAVTQGAPDWIVSAAVGVYLLWRAPQHG